MHPLSFSNFMPMQTRYLCSIAIKETSHTCRKVNGLEIMVDVLERDALLSSKNGLANVIELTGRECNPGK